jgi:L-methionine (R)-S-oxide reductase
MNYVDLFDEIKSNIKLTQDKTEVMQIVCDTLFDYMPYYNWVGFYLVDENNSNQLLLGPYIGDPTEHVTISFGVGICGQAALTQKTLLVNDVTRETNYLSCNPFVKSEIVVPIFKDGKFVGELDIDSHTNKAFTDNDRIFLERICQLTSHVF